MPPMKGLSPLSRLDSKRKPHGIHGKTETSVKERALRSETRKTLGKSICVKMRLK